jgi:hypothetical protein
MTCIAASVWGILHRSRRTVVSDEHHIQWWGEDVVSKEISMRIWVEGGADSLRICELNAFNGGISYGARDLELGMTCKAVGTGPFIIRVAHLAAAF